MDGVKPGHDDVEGDASRKEMLRVTPPEKKSPAFRRDLPASQALA
jgi:hypothetical protein